ncbi:MAG: hypothetical protein GY870_09610, partial [archaeon]|nr:hypothetical protein [archaeon]
NKKVDEKFDLIWLLNHSPESYETEINDIYKTVDYVLIFVTDSKRKYTSIERLTNSFKARLNPLFQLFIETLKESDYVLFNPGEEIGGNLTPYYFYGHEQKNENVVNEITDALEFSNKIKLKKQPIINC